MAGRSSDSRRNTWPRMVGGEKSRRAAAVAHVTHVGGPGANVVARIEHVDAETMTGAQFGVGRGHDLHEAERAGEKPIGLGANKPTACGFASIRWALHASGACNSSALGLRAEALVDDLLKRRGLDGDNTLDQRHG